MDTGTSQAQQPSATHTGEPARGQLGDVEQLNGLAPGPFSRSLVLFKFVGLRVVMLCYCSCCCDHCALKQPKALCEVFVTDRKCSLVRLCRWVVVAALLSVVACGWIRHVSPNQRQQMHELSIPTNCTYDVPGSTGRWMDLFHSIFSYIMGDQACCQRSMRSMSVPAVMHS